MYFFFILDNKIERIEGLEYCRRLRNLNLGHNHIKKIDGLKNLPLVNLDLVYIPTKNKILTDIRQILNIVWIFKPKRCNQIRYVEGLESLQLLRYLNLSGNQIRTLKGMPSADRLEFLEVLDLESNKVSQAKR
jgi:Leucine-rich repeat (LRR) protein